MATTQTWVSSSPVIILLHHISSLWWVIPLTFVRFNVQHHSKQPFMQDKVITGSVPMSYFSLVWLWVLWCCFTYWVSKSQVCFLHPCQISQSTGQIEGLLGSSTLPHHSSAWLFLAWPTSGQMIVTALFVMLYWSLKEKFNFPLASLPAKVTAHIQLQKACRNSAYCLETYQQCRLLLLEVTETEAHVCQDVTLLHDGPHGVYGLKVDGLKVRENHEIGVFHH